MKTGFIVTLQLFGGSCQPIFREDEDLMFFDTREAAQKEIDECLADVKDAVKRGDMDSEYEQDDYAIYPAKLVDTTIICDIDGVIHTCDLKDEDWQ